MSEATVLGCRFPFDHDPICTMHARTKTSLIGETVIGAPAGVHSAAIFVDWTSRNGGAQVSTGLLIQSLVRSGSTRVVVVAPNGENLEFAERVGADPVRCGDRSWDLRVLDVLRLVLTTMRLAIRMHVYVMHVNSPVSGLAVRIVGGILPRVKLVYHYRAVGGASWRARLLLRAVMRGADAVIVPASAGREDAVSTLGVSPARVCVIPNPVAGLEADIVPDVEGSGSLTVVMVSRNEPFKGLDVALEALEILTTQYCMDVKLRLVCDLNDSMNRSYAEEMRAWVERMGELVDVLIPPVDVDAVIASANVVWMPSRLEAFGRVAAEALAVGRPVIGTRVGGLVEVLGPLGACIEPGDAVGLANMTRRVLGDPSLRARMVSRRGEILHFSEIGVASKVEEVYRRL